MIAFLFALLFAPGIVQSFGYCIDVTSDVCSVRVYWPRDTRVTSVGQDAYWLGATDGRVCFVTRAVYERAVVGQPSDCLWREARP